MFHINALQANNIKSQKSLHKTVKSNSMQRQMRSQFLLSQRSQEKLNEDMVITKVSQNNFF